MKKEKWASRTTFILAAIGSAVGLGNAWRFPGLCAAHGGGTFILVYLIGMLVLGIPLLMMEIAIGRKTQQGAVGAMYSMNKKLAPIGWAATGNAFFIVSYYAVVFAWVLLMIPMSLKFIGMTGDAAASSKVFADSIQTTWDVTGYSIPPVMILALIAAWGLMYYCIRDGASSVGKVVKYTVFAPVVLLAIMAVKGLTMPGAMEGIKLLFTPSLAALADPTIWVDAFGQCFYSLSIMMAIMFAYGAFLHEKANLAVDCMIIAFSDLAISILSAIVMFSTMGGVGMLNDITSSGIATAFIVYPSAIVNLTGNGVFNAIFGMIFYLMLATLAIDSAFSIVEGISTSISAYYGLDHKKMTRIICLVSGILSILFITRAGLGWLDIVDHWTNQINLILIGVLECGAIGWCFSTEKVLAEVNRNTVKFKMPSAWFRVSIKFIAPLLLLGLFLWNMITLFTVSGGHYGYPLWAELIGGWGMSVVVFVCGFVAQAIAKKKGIEPVDASAAWKVSAAEEKGEDYSRSMDGGDK
jgi:NSS family neurotransmitter:Na+ symporter